MTVYCVFSIRDMGALAISGPLMETNNKLVAYAYAKRAAGKRAQFTGSYGPESVAYIGKEVTAVVSRKQYCVGEAK